MINAEKKVSLQFNFDLKSKKMVGTIIDGDNEVKVENIDLRIFDAVKNGLIKTTDWFEEFKDFIESNKHIEAFELFELNQWSIVFFEKKITDDILLLDKSKLEKEQRKNYYLYIISIATKESELPKIEKEIDEFLREFEDSFDKKVLQSIILSKANIAASIGKINVANSLYNRVIENPETLNWDKAAAYRGLSIISPSIDDKFLYQKKAIDKWLEIGKKTEAIKDLNYLSDIFEKDDPKKSLELIDTAINLYEGESGLDKEFSASLYYRKSKYLFSLNRYPDALESIEKSISLREDLFGNEYEKYYSLSHALNLCKIIRNNTKYELFAQKLDMLIPQINSEEFQLNIKIKNVINNKAIFPPHLIQEIESSFFPFLKLELYLYNATIAIYSYEEQIEWCDKAILILNEQKCRSYVYSSVYFTLAEVHRKANKVNEAIVTYEKSIEYNPFNNLSIQNCKEVLWQHKKWEKSKSFFGKLIEKLGETPTLSYEYGRSLFECGEYQGAYNHFAKAKGKVENVDITSYIYKCTELYDGLILEQPKSIIKDEPISLDSLKETLYDFAKSISTNSRMYFWKNESNEYKWTSSPEELGKQLLINALEVKYGKGSIEITPEKSTGAGRIDLYITLRGGIKVVIELKMCGFGYSSPYAISGEDQLLHYLKNTETNVAFLIVFDARSRDYGKGFKPTQSIESYTIYTIPIEMNPKVINK